MIPLFARGNLRKAKPICEKGFEPSLASSIVIAPPERVHVEAAIVVATRLSKNQVEPKAYHAAAPLV